MAAPSFFFFSKSDVKPRDDRAHHRFRESSTLHVEYVFSACVYIASHVDDCLVTGPQEELLELGSQLKKRYEVHGDVLGLEEGEARRAKLLERTIRAREWGIEVKADGRLVKGLLEEYDPDSTKVFRYAGHEVGRGRNA